jgi:hypothetical protein
MNDNSNETLQELKRISRRSAVAAWSSSIIAASMITNHFFPKVVRQLAESTESIDRFIATHKIATPVTIIYLAFVLGFPALCIWYVFAKISGAKKP